MNKFQGAVLAVLSTLLITLTGCMALSESLGIRLKAHGYTAVLVWANEAAVTINSYNYAYYRENLHAASRYFTPDGWNAYLKAFRLSGNLDTAIKKRLVVSAVAIGTPVILEKGVVNKKYTWKVQLPLLITSESAVYKKSQRVVVTMVIVRTPEDIGVRGLGIEQYVVVPR